MDTVEAVASMSLDLSAIEKYAGRRQSCSVKLAIDSLRPKDRRLVHEALVTERITAAAVAKWFQMDKGLNVSGQSVRRHRRGECSCD